MEYYSEIIKNDLLINGATWKNMENILLSERSQSPKLMLYDLFYMKCQKQVNLWGQKVALWFSKKLKAEGEKERYVSECRDPKSSMEI